jgi:5,10-methylene-tetrahydrofolate dehydrogenase/Methenyl tetrahydrofolate cyclohydrolase
MVVIFNGKKRQKEKLEILKSDIEKLKANNIIPKLAIINVSKNPSSLIYIRNKINILKELNLLYEIFNLEENVNEETIIKLINKLNEDKNVNGILIQLPLPPHLDTYKIINSINPIKDVDGLTSYNLGKLMAKDETLAPCTPKAIIDILESSNIKVEGSDIVIVNNSIVVGKPLSIMLTNRFATVSICHIKTKDLKSYTKNADIVITATGVPKLIKKNT